MAKQPNLFIVGAPKCGTTSIASYLSTHPDIFVPAVKEPHYFAEDFDNFRAFKNIGDYLSLYAKATKEKYLCDASVWYLYSKNALRNIWNFNSNAKIIVLLRNPADMLPSLHQQLFYTLDEDVPDFKKAWDLQEQREKGISIPPKCREKRFLQYAEVANYTNQISRLFNYFPKEQVKIILFDDLAGNAGGIYSEVLDFLNLEHDGRTHFPKINIRKTYRSKTISQLVHRPPKIATFLSKVVRVVFRINQLNILKNLGNYNRKQIPKTVMDEKTRQDIVSSLKSSLVQLETIINRDLRHWYQS